MDVYRKNSKYFYNLMINRFLKTIDEKIRLLCERAPSLNMCSACVLHFLLASRSTLNLLFIQHLQIDANEKSRGRVLNDYCTDSTLHGIRFLADPKRSRLSK